MKSEGILARLLARCGLDLGDRYLSRVFWSSYAVCFLFFFGQVRIAFLREGNRRERLSIEVYVGLKLFGRESSDHGKVITPERYLVIGCR